MKNFLNFIEEYQSLIIPLISSVLSYYVAKSKAKSEVDKLLLTWSRKDKSDFSDAFNHLISATSKYYCNSEPRELENALTATARFMSIAPREFHNCLLRLDDALNEQNVCIIPCIREEIMLLYSDRIKQNT